MRETYAVLRLVDEGADGDRVLRVEDVAVGRIVDDDRGGQVAAQHAQVLPRARRMTSAGRTEAKEPVLEQNAVITCYASSRSPSKAFHR